MIQKIVMWALVPPVAAILAALAGGPLLGYDPLLSMGWALSASVVILWFKPASRTLLLLGLALGAASYALAKVSQIPQWLEWLAECALGFAVVSLVTFVVAYATNLVNWVQTRGQH